MELSPAQIAEASFRTTRKGYDPTEVDAFLADAARALEEARQQATAMEARARAAVARLQEVSAASAGAEVGTEPHTSSELADLASVQIPVAQSETISRTLLLAQRTADTTVADARAEAEQIVQQATAEAEATIDSTREMSAQMLEDARAEARRSTETERQNAANEVQALVARREFLIGDVDQLERFLIDQRDRLRGAAQQIEALCERVPAGLGSVRPPALSASDDDEPGDPTQEMMRPAANQAPDDDTDRAPRMSLVRDTDTIAVGADADPADDSADDEHVDTGDRAEATMGELGDALTRALDDTGGTDPQALPVRRPVGSDNSPRV